MRLQLLFIFSLLTTITAVAQIDEPDMAVNDSIPATDSTLVDIAEPKEPAQVISVSFLLDYGKIGLSAISDEVRYEGGVNLTFFDHYSLIAEYGYGDLNPRNALQNGQYFSEGNYFRVGGGYMNNLDAVSKLGLSVRYGQSSFTDQGEVYVESASGIQQGYETSFGPRNSEARWVEVVITSESRIVFDKSRPDAKINHLISLGFHFRLRFMSSYDRYPIYDTYSVPGYGRTVNNPNPALNLFIRFKAF